MFVEGSTLSEFLNFESTKVKNDLRCEAVDRQGWGEQGATLVDNAAECMGVQSTDKRSSSEQ